MSDTSKLSTCQMVCWGLSGLTGVIVLWSAAGSVGVLAGLILAAAFLVLLGLASTRLICTGYPSDDVGFQARDVEATLRQASGVTGFKAPDPEEDVAPSSANASDLTASAATAAEAPSAAPLGGEPERGAREGDRGDEGRHDAQAGATRPKALNGPRDGHADDLKKIKGVGPKMEVLINELGFYHFDQIATWTEAEVAWVDENLKGFKGRVSRDNWVDQAKTLAAGGETEFSTRVDKGDVY